MHLPDGLSPAVEKLRLQDVTTVSALRLGADRLLATRAKFDVAVQRASLACLCGSTGYHRQGWVTPELNSPSPCISPLCDKFALLPRDLLG